MGNIRNVKDYNMQEKRILPRRRGGVLLCVLGCLFVFFVKTEKDLAAAGNILWTAGYVGSTLLWTVLLGCLLGVIGMFVVYRAAERPAPEGAGKDNAVFCRSAAWIQNRSGAQVFSEVCYCYALHGFRYIWHITRESVLMMHRYRPDRSWSIIILIIIRSCTRCFYMGCCGWERSCPGV